MPTECPECGFYFAGDICPKCGHNRRPKSVTLYIASCGDCLDFPGRGFYCRITGRRCKEKGDAACESFIQRRKQTNGDRLRKMHDKELARQFVRKHEERGELTTYSAEIPFLKWRTGSCNEAEVIEATAAELKETAKE